MHLVDIVRRTLPPEPWAEGDNIPWNDAAFSERMLREHLRQDHDAASRRTAKVAEQVRWIHEQVLAERPSRVLDLACGPGLYTSRPAALGHTCHGVDFAPAAIQYARGAAAEAGLACSYDLADLRGASFGSGFGLVMLISGQLNVFRREEASDILGRAFAALEPGGRLLLEPQLFETVEAEGQAPPAWLATPSGLFSDRPHLRLVESAWDAARRVSTRRYYVIDAASGEVERYALSNEAYTDDEYVTLVSRAGFAGIRLLPSLVGGEDASQAGNLVVLARRPG